MRLIKMFFKRADDILAAYFEGVGQGGVILGEYVGNIVNVFSDFAWLLVGSLLAVLMFPVWLIGYCKKERKGDRS